MPEYIVRIEDNQIEAIGGLVRCNGCTCYTPIETDPDTQPKQGYCKRWSRIHVEWFYCAAADLRRPEREEENV